MNLRRIIFNKKKYFIVILMIIATIVILLLIFSGKKDKKTEYNYTKIEKRDIQIIVSSTGTLKPKGIVEIGTQVSGTVSKVFFNYNDSVKKGELLAILDTTLLEIAVKLSEADLIKTRSQYNHNLKDFENKTNLLKEKLISNYEYNASKVSIDSSYAQLLSAEANLDKAKANLSYCYIRSPIDGTIIDKNIEEGQTVASSLSSPTLFIIAENLSNMEIHALVDESDISKIRSGQTVRFTIDSNSELSFGGKVREVRLNPTIESNVVNYKVVIDAQNKNNILLPGMTATIDFIIEARLDVYSINNSALKLAMTEDMSQYLNKTKAGRPDKVQRDTILDDNEKNNEQVRGDGRNKNRDGNTINNADDKKKRIRPSVIWILKDSREIEPVFVRTGLTDGIYTELLDIREDKLELNYISTIVSKHSGNKKNSNTTNNYKNNMRMMQGQPPRF